jgi:hypothetical protein
MSGSECASAEAESRGLEILFSIVRLFVLGEEWMDRMKFEMLGLGCAERYTPAPGFRIFGH